LYRIAVSGTGTYPTQEYLNLFATNDVRRQLFILKAEGYSATSGGVVYSDGVREYYYRGSKMLFNQGITYPELLLMRAEAYARTNDPGNALADLNLLRTYRYDNAGSTDLPGGSALSRDELLYEILKERRREMPFATFQRTLDLKRFAVYDTGQPWTKTTVTHTLGANTYTAPVSDFRVTIDNPTILYNPQWGLTEYVGTWAPTVK
jgi:hypothetical protein